MRIEEKILLEENELKPNRHMATVALGFFAVIFIVGLFNELGIFHVNTLRMRVCFVIVLVCTTIAQLLGRGKKTARSRKTKYLVLAVIVIETLAITTVLSQWAELLTVLPILLAMQYHNKRLTRWAIAGTLAVAAVSAPLSIWLGLPQLDFYDFLVRTTGYRIDAISPDPGFNRWYYMLKSFQYMSIPRCLLVAASGVICGYITRSLSANVKSRADATYLSTTDVVTGVLNRFSFEEKLEGYRMELPDRLLCIYADADGLHELNNAQGHAAGDALLKTCARQMRKAFGEMTYRLGGDEFLSFVEHDSLQAASVAAEDIARVMEDRGYHMSMGVCRMEEGETIDELIKRAESQMYAEKHAFYVRSGKDRRKNR